MYARIRRIIFCPVREFEGLRTKCSPIDNQGIQVLLFLELHDNPGRIVRVQDFAPPHRVHVAVGQMAATYKSPVVLGRPAVNRLAQEPGRPFLFARSPEARAVVAARTVPVVIVRQTPVREAEHIVAAIDQGGRHVEVTGRRIPYGKVGSQHVVLVDGNARMLVIHSHHVLCSKGCTDAKPKHGDYQF